MPTQEHTPQQTWIDEHVRWRLPGEPEPYPWDDDAELGPPDGTNGRALVDYDPLDPDRY